MRITIGKESRDYPDDFERVLETDMADVAEWVFNALEEKHRRTLDAVVARETDRNPKKLTIAAKHDLLKDIELPRAADEAARIEAEITGGAK